MEGDGDAIHTFCVFDEQTKPEKERERERERERENRPAKCIAGVANKTNSQYIKTKKNELEEREGEARRSSSVWKSEATQIAKK